MVFVFGTTGYQRALVVCLDADWVPRSGASAPLGPSGDTARDPGIAAQAPTNSLAVQTSAPNSPAESGAQTDRRLV